MDKITTLYCFAWLCILGLHGTYGVHIQFFEKSNLITPVFESSSTEKCNNKELKNWAIKTDACVVTYMHSNCRSYWSKTFLPNENTTTTFGTLGSFHICNEDAGGVQLNLDITTYYENESTVPNVIQSYKNLCSCVNVSPQVQNLDKWSINPNGNELWAYFEPNCSDTKWKPLYIFTGDWGYTRDIINHKRIDPTTQKVYKIQSFGPAPNATYFNTSCSLSMLALKNQTKVEQIQLQINHQEIKFQNFSRNFVQLNQTCQDSEQMMKSFQLATENRLNDHLNEYLNVTENVNGIQQEVRQLKLNLETCQKHTDDVRRGYTKEFLSLNAIIKELQNQTVQLTQKIHDLESNAQKMEINLDNGRKEIDDKFEKQQDEFNEIQAKFINHVHM